MDSPTLNSSIIYLKELVEEELDLKINMNQESIWDGFIEFSTTHPYGLITFMEPLYSDIILRRSF